MRKNEKAFDCVATMREIRDELSKKFSHMTLAEQKRYIRERVRLEPGVAAETGRV